MFSPIEVACFWIWVVGIVLATIGAPIYRGYMETRHYTEYGPDDGALHLVCAVFWPAVALALGIMYVGNGLQTLGERLGQRPAKKQAQLAERERILNTPLEQLVREQETRQ